MRYDRPSAGAAPEAVIRRPDAHFWNGSTKRCSTAFAKSPTSPSARAIEWLGFQGGALLVATSASTVRLAEETTGPLKTANAYAQHIGEDVIADLWLEEKRVAVVAAAEGVRQRLQRFSSDSACTPARIFRWAPPDGEAGGAADHRAA